VILLFTLGCGCNQEPTNHCRYPVRHEKAADFRNLWHGGVHASAGSFFRRTARAAPCSGTGPRRTTHGPPLRRRRGAAPAPAKRGTQQLAKGALTNARAAAEKATTPLSLSLSFHASLGASVPPVTHISVENTVLIRFLKPELDRPCTSPFLTELAPFRRCAARLATSTKFSRILLLIIY